MNLLNSKANPKKSNEYLGDINNLTLTVKPINASHSLEDGLESHRRERVIIDPDLLRLTNLDRRQNVRLQNKESGHKGAFTIYRVEVQDDPLTIRIGSEGWKKLGFNDFNSETEVEVLVSTSMFKEGIDTVDDAQQEGEIIELLEDGGGSTIFIESPHGGNIELATSAQGQMLFDGLASYSPVWWDVRGFRYQHDGVLANTFDKWHITSTDIYPPSWPLLDSILDRDYDYGVSMHGYSNTDQVEVGGDAPETFLNDVVAAIEGAVPESIDVMVTNDPVIAGDDPRNITNRVCPTGNTVQVEQSLEARQQYGADIANALVTFFDNEIT